MQNQANVIIEVNNTDGSVQRSTSLDSFDNGITFSPSTTFNQAGNTFIIKLFQGLKYLLPQTLME